MPIGKRADALMVHLKRTGYEQKSRFEMAAIRKAPKLVRFSEMPRLDRKLVNHPYHPNQLVPEKRAA